MTTAIQFQQQVRRALGLSGTDEAALPAVDTLEAVNSALHSISTEQEWGWQFLTETGALVADTNTLALPATYVRTSSLSVLYDNDERELLAHVAHDDFEADDDVPGEPAFFARVGDDLILWPTPDDAYGYRHYYYGLEPALVADADVPLLPDQFSRWLVVEAAYRLNLRTVSPEKYNELRAEAQEWRERARRWNFRNSLPLPEITLTRESVWQDI